MKANLTIYCSIETTNFNDVRDAAMAVQQHLETLPVIDVLVENIDTEEVS